MIERKYLRVFSAAFLLFTFHFSPFLFASESNISLDLELDAYYSDVALYVPLTEKKITRAIREDELNAYRRLMSSSLIPQFLVVEGSINPLPCTGVLIRKHAPGFYDNADYSDGQNLIRAITTHFNEPYALALFLGNVVDYSPGKKELGRSSKGYIGYLFAGGNYHIQDSALVYDNWVEFEWKVKGDQRFDDRKLSWSFRVGSKFHDNSEITDRVYTALRRSRVDYKDTRSWLRNSGVEYVASFDKKKFRSVSHKLLFDKKFPRPGKKIVFIFKAGYIWKGKRFYSGKLAQERISGTSQIVIQPNIEF
ncbi:hypothetical protein ACFL6Y_11310 [Elusimicrobiota bacterium]